MIYIAITILLFLLTFHFDYQGHTRYRLEWYIFVLIVFICLAGFRYRIGIDSVRYSMGYPALPDLEEFWSYDFDQTHYGRGYLLLNAVARSISDNFVVMQFILATFVNCVLLRFFYKNTRNIFFACLLYFIFQYFNYNFEILRESCAISVFILAWPYFANDKWWKYYICAAIAVLFHPSAIFTLLLPFIKLPIFRKIFTPNLLTPLIMVGMFLLGIIISRIFFDWIKALEFATMDEYAKIYENSHYAESTTLNIVGILAFLIKLFIYPLGMIWIFKNDRFQNTRHLNSGYYNSLMMLFLCYIYISGFTISLQILYRFTNYLAPFFILLLSDAIFNRIKVYHKRFRLSFSIWMIILFPLLLLNIYGSFEPVGESGIIKIHRYYPYASVFSQETDRQREMLFNYEGI